MSDIEREDIPQAQFGGWARVEVMGHQTHIGYVKTQAFGAAVLFRIDVPEIPEREYVLTEPEYVEGRWTKAGAKVRRAAIKGGTVLVGAGSIYRIVPCTEAAALKAIDATMSSPLKLVEAPPEHALDAMAEEDRSDDEDDRDPYDEDQADDDEDLPL